MLITMGNQNPFLRS